MLWRVTNAWQRAIRAALGPFGITHVQFVLLAVLASLGRSASITQRELADRANSAVEGADRAFFSVLGSATEGFTRSLVALDAGEPAADRTASS